MTDLGREPYDVWLEHELRDAAPQARALFVDELARRVRVQRFRMRPSRARMGLAVGFSALMIAALGVLGAPALVAHAATAIVNTATTVLKGGGTSSTTGLTGATSGSSQYETPEPICHRTGDAFNPTWTLVTDVPSAHDGHPDIVPAPPWGCPPNRSPGGPPSETTTSISSTDNPPIATPLEQKSFFVSVRGAAALGAPHGTIECFDNRTRFATVDAPLGTARCSVGTLGAGTHAITAVFKTGDVSKWASSAGNVLSVGVSKASSDVRVLTSENPAPFGAGVTFTAVASGPAAASMPTGTAQFFDGSSALAAPMTLTAAGTAVLSTSGLSAGSHTIRVAYSGDATYAAAVATVSQMIEAPAPAPAPLPAPGPASEAQQEPPATTTTVQQQQQQEPTPPQVPPASLTTTTEPATAGAVAVAPMSGTAAPTTVAWTSTTFGSAPVHVSASVEAPVATSGIQFASGSAVIQIDAVTDSGQPITTLNAALDIAIPNAPADVAPMYQRGNAPWVVIPRLGGSTLPAGQPDGWYLEGSTLHILTRHLTKFGLAKALDVRWGTRRRVSLRWAQRIVVYGAPSIDAQATYTLRRGKTVYGRWARTLPAGKGAPANLWLTTKRVKPGRYKLTIVVTAGPQHWTQVVAIRYL
jgi:Bacterial Ig-like domain (group 3)